MNVSSQNKERTARIACSLLSDDGASAARLTTIPFFSFLHTWTITCVFHSLLLLNVQLKPAASGACFLLSRQPRMWQPNACQDMWVTWGNDFKNDTTGQCMSRYTWINPLLTWICCVATYPGACYKNDICVPQQLATVQWYTSVPETIWGPRSRRSLMWLCLTCLFNQLWPLKQQVLCQQMT